MPLMIEMTAMMQLMVPESKFSSLTAAKCYQHDLVVIFQD